MAKKRVYVESSVISYLTARPARDIIKLAKQQQTWDWWERRHEWDLFVSQTVLEEISGGDLRAADLRMEKALMLTMLPGVPDARNLAELLVRRAAIPVGSEVDAVHLALAAVHRMDYLVTWNQTHLDNPVMRAKIADVIREQGLSPAFVVTPEQLMELNHD
jgi:hypothetical protein